MTQYLISYTASDGSVTIGAIGESLADALAALVDEFGESVLQYYEHTHNELTQLVGIVAGDEAGRPAAPSEQAPGPDEAPARSETVDEGAGSERALMPIFCSICDTEISSDQAVASRVLYDEPRCVKHTTG